MTLWSRITGVERCRLSNSLFYQYIIRWTYHNGQLQQFQKQRLSVFLYLQSFFCSFTNVVDHFCLAIKVIYIFPEIPFWFRLSTVRHHSTLDLPYLVSWASWPKRRESKWRMWHRVVSANPEVKLFMAHYWILWRLHLLIWGQLADPSLNSLFTKATTISETMGEFANDNGANDNKIVLMIITMQSVNRPITPGNAVGLCTDFSKAFETGWWNLLQS